MSKTGRRSYSLRMYVLSYSVGGIPVTVTRKGRTERSVKRAFLASLDRKRAPRGSGLTVKRMTAGDM